MTLLLRYSIPDVPKVVGSPLILAEYTILRRGFSPGQGSPPNTSLAISWAFTMRSGYALAPLMDTPKTRSLGSR